RRNYSPDAVTMILVGDIAVDKAASLMETIFGSWQGQRTAVRTQVDESSRTTSAVSLVAKEDAAQSELRIGHVGVERTHPDYFGIVVMNAVLGGLFSSRINLNLREAHGYTYGASSYYDWRRNAGPFVISTAVQSEVTAEAIKETLSEIDRMRSEEIPEDELTLATNYLDGVFPIRYETTSAIASALASMVIFGLPADYYDTYRQKVRAVSTADVLAAAKNHVNADGLQVLVVGDPAIVREPMELLGIGPVMQAEMAE
ncbi:MAG: insulinase family protein, partial [Gemmatimonadota bacterium]|nr:insulinase family protein [Gemmatimonadota bacterium]